MLPELDAGLRRGDLPPVDASGAAKLLVTSRALRLRRDRPELFTRYTPMTVVGEAADHAIAFDRGGALTVATRLPVGLAARGGWGDTVLLRHVGSDDGCPHRARLRGLGDPPRRAAGDVSRRAADPGDGERAHD